ncbi:MAG: ATP-dependent metallopeptidase FtsH/Yme1/Tma family protein [Chthoniobacterales bacterium]|nr:ATP-dependent metallopeptidase FtsH/Yme1/Tma family protein [Chthoniobacterales bacterium]
MALPDRNSSKDNKPRTGDPNFNWRGVILFAIAFALIGLAILFRGGTGYSAEENVPYNRFLELLEHKQLVNDPKYPLLLVVEEGRPTQSIRGAYTRPGVGNAPAQQVPFRTTIYLNFTTDLQQKLADAGMQPGIRTESNVLAQAVIGFVPIALFLLILYFLFRQQIRMAGKGALSFGKSKARMLARDKNKITFKDVAGVEEAKDEVQELVEFLRDPKKFQKLGGRIPKGVLLVGPPGTGKTLLARAIAGEADVPFFSISGSDFVEMFVGVGASRVRDMFEQGKKSAPCIIFIDEIDAVGRHRGHGVGGGHDEREQTLNALLVEMDGFDTQEGVIIIAATNRPDVLDPALLRPGRFDRQITVNLPDVKGREEILRVHSRKVKLAEGVDLAVVARGTPGYSGAELANVINEAALLAARRGLKGITLSELEEARDKVRWGKERRSLALSEKEKTNTAYHEAGHALLLEMLEFTEPLHKVTIIPRGPSLGSTMWLPLEDKYTQRRNELLDDLVVSMGGRVAEEIVFGDVTSGARGDIQIATRLARKMVCEWGMSEKMGMVEYGEHEDYVFLGRDISRARDYSEATAEQIDREVRKLVDDAYGRATEILTAQRSKLEVIAKALLEFETLDGVQIREVIEHGRLLNPPGPRPPASGEMLAPEKPPKQIVIAPDVAPPLPGGLSGAPA